MPIESSESRSFKSREWFESAEGQREVSEFIDKLKRDVGNPKDYEETCRKADVAESKLTEEILEPFFTKFESLIEKAPPGHDINHIRRDALCGLALISNDEFVKKAFSQADIQAGILGSIFHDIGNAVTKRYEDNHRQNGHAEIGAFIFWQTSEGIIDENIRKLAAYAIAAHTHYLKPMPVKEPQGYERQPYWYEIFYPEENKPCGLAPILTRFSDRLEVNGGIIVARTMLGNADAFELGGGREFQGEQGFFEIKKESLIALFYPQIRESKPIPPSALEHALMFANSNFGKSIYSKDDHLFPFMDKLMKHKVNELEGLIKIVSAPPDMMNFSSLEAEAVAKDTIRQISGSKNFERAWNVLKLAWESLDDETKARWENGFKYVQKTYLEWIDLLRESASDDYKEIAENLARQCI